MNPATYDIQETPFQPDRYDTIIDARTPAEYELDHLPGAINLPVLNDAERAEIGTLYAANPFRAKREGAAKIARNIANYLEGVLADKPKSWHPLIYCWRGGQRSGSMATILARVGWQVALLKGGYQSYRRHLLQVLPDLATRFQFRVLCGVTGSGKSRLLGELAKQGAQVLDLEKLANHKGSILGEPMDSEQPSQKLFESNLWFTLSGFDRNRPVFVESESRKIGRIHVPEPLIEHMRAAPCLQIEAGLETRIAILREEYPHFESDTASLLRLLQSLTRTHGKEKVAQWAQKIEAAQFDEFVADILALHYDPLYSHSMPRNYKGFGNAQTVPLASNRAEDLDRATQEILSLGA